MLPARLAHTRVVLASASPRRKQILEGIGIAAEVVPSTFPETLDKAAFASPAGYVLATAEGKGKEVLERVAAAGGEPPLVVAADTIVVLGNEILEKPESPEAAMDMLSRLSGRSHTVLTAVVLLHPDPRAPGGPPLKSAFVEETEVFFAELSEQEVEAYVATGEPMDKAGGYGYQTGAGSLLVERINGCHYNVVGFPTHRFARELRHFLDKLP
ncbi:N-acetylserotonin O-methyltransferase-like protein-like protein [Hyaloraphidium curvatum]|nr:N-acetylserotonin O-methyltransferase-like protein-like protein [Hyaloraphidium curvatum]